MSPEELLRAFGAALALGDVAAAAALFAPDAVYDEPPRFHFEGRPAISAFITDFAACHTEVSFTVTRSLASADGALLAAEWRWAYRRMDGAQRAFAGMCFVEMREGLIARWRGFSARIPETAR
jgi:ketosteroid isomerase-like protein